MFRIENLVSLETLNKFRIYETLLREWNRRTSLVQEETLKEFYSRHVIDSLQTIPIITNLFGASSSSTFSLVSAFSSGMRFDDISDDLADLMIMDVGTGAGFPGFILAMCGFSNVSLCESNHRKCVFLEEVARQTNTKVDIMNSRIETVSERFDIILSRAVTELVQLLPITQNLSRTHLSRGIFHKGRNWKSEIDVSQKNWKFEYEVYDSITSSDSVLIVTRELLKI